MSESINTKYDVNTKLTPEMIQAKQSPYYGKGAVQSPAADVVEIQGKEGNKNSKYKKWGKIGAGIAAVALATVGIIFGKKKIDAKKVEKLEAEARKLAEEAKIKAEVEAKKAEEKARLEAEKQAELRAQQEAKLKSQKEAETKAKAEAERIAQETAKQKIVTHKKEIFSEFGTSKKYDETIRYLQTYQYGKDGIPLKYSRDSFLTDLSTELGKLSPAQRANIEHRFNIKLNPTGYNKVGVELEGIPTIPTNLAQTESEQKFATIIRKFTQENEVLLENPEQKEILDAILQEIPEFTAIIGKKQHHTHQYSVDVHTLKNLSSNLSNIRAKGLNEDSQTVLKYSTILHDLGKCFIEDYVPDRGHAALSTEIAKPILERLNLKPEIKERVLKQIQNHHWFERYNKGEMSAKEVIDLFGGNKQDITIAEIMAKSDLANVNSTFHYGCMGIFEKDACKAAKDYEEIMQNKFGMIDDIINEKIAKEKGLVPDVHGIRPIASDEEFFEVMDKLHDKRFRTIYCMGDVQSSFNGPRILEGSSFGFAVEDYVADIPSRMSSLPAYIGVNSAGSNTNYELYRELNTYLSKNKDVYMSPIDSGVKIWSDEGKALLREHLVNMDSETAKEFIRVIDYSLKEVDREFGKFDGIVYRNGYFNPESGQFWSTSKNHDLTLVGDKSEFHVIKTKNGHNLSAFQEKYYHVHENEAEVLLPRGTKYREITDGSKYQEERLKMAKARYEMFKSFDEMDIQNGKKPEYNYTFEDVLARTHVWEEI